MMYVEMAIKRLSLVICVSSGNAG